MSKNLLNASRKREPSRGTFLARVMLGLVVIVNLSQSYPSLASENEQPASTRSTYLLGPEDQITVSSTQCEEVSNKPVRIDSSGFVNLPLVGRMKAAELTVPQFEENLTQKLKTFYVEPQVSVSITQFRSQPVSVVGSVSNPGVHQLEGRKTVLEMLSLAGGVRPDAGSVLKITRQSDWGAIPLPGVRNDLSGRYSVAEINLTDLMAGLNPAQNIAVCPNDVLAVQKADLVYVLGEVKKSGGFVLGAHSSITVLEAVSMAEGFQLRAAPNHARILRSRQGNELARKEVAVDLSKILAGKTSDVLLEPNDILYIPDSAAKNLALRTLEAAIQIGTGVAIFH